MIEQARKKMKKVCIVEDSIKMTPEELQLYQEIKKERE